MFWGHCFKNFENGASVLNRIVFCLGKFGGWGWKESQGVDLVGVRFKISADMTTNRGLFRRDCWFEMRGIPARGPCEVSVRVMSCGAGITRECLWDAGNEYDCGVWMMCVCVCVCLLCQFEVMGVP